jgi:hypothetical protein
MIIPLGHTLPCASSDRTRRHWASNPYPHSSAVGQMENAPLFGLAPGGVYQAPDVTTGTGALLPHRFTLTRSRGIAARRSTQAPGGLFSVALSLGSPPLDVIQHPALRSPDFPPFAGLTKSDHLTSFALLSVGLAATARDKTDDASHNQGRQ